MRETIICTGKTGSTEYVFPETSVGISSYEELCYYLREHMAFYVNSLPEEALSAYISEELGLSHLGKQLYRVDNPQTDQMKYFSALFREGNYYSEDEIKEILDEYRIKKEAPRYQQYKWIGDLYLQYRRYVMAIRYYDKALEEEIPEGDLTVALYHNRAVANARLFHFSSAKIDFLRAYQHGGEEESLFSYYALVAFEKGTSKANEELVDFDTVEMYKDTFEQRFAEIPEEFEYSKSAERFKRVEYLMNHHRTDEAARLHLQYIRERQNEFRHCVYEDESVSFGTLPDTYANTW